jgi:hypothetical protein
MMKLRYGSTSPFVRKVLVTAIETGQDGEIERVKTNTADPELATCNPLNKIPALTLDDGSILIDSAVICEFLDTRKGGKLTMRFVGKHGIVHEANITDSNLKRVVKRCQELPGQMLFQYVNGDGEPQAITSSDVNDYIREATKGDFTAKHFRTWGASVIAFDQLLKKSENSRISIKTVVEPVAEALGNTVAMSRKSYVHPALLDAVKEDSRDPLDGMDRPRGRTRLSSQEVGLLEFLARGAKQGRRRKAVNRRTAERQAAA